jgi:hypothetical protein
LEALTIYVPQNGRLENDRLGPVLSGSAIVGSPTASETRLTIDFEGNKFESEQLRRYERRAQLAAGRLAKSYPTVARQEVSWEQLIPVARAIRPSDEQAFFITAITDSEKLQSWLGDEELPIPGGSIEFRYDLVDFYTRRNAAFCKRLGLGDLLGPWVLPLDAVNAFVERLLAYARVMCH